MLYWYFHAFFVLRLDGHKENFLRHFKQHIFKRRAKAAKMEATTKFN